MKGIFAALIFMAITFVMFARILPGPDPFSHRLRAELGNLRRMR